LADGGQEKEEIGGQLVFGKAASILAAICVSFGRTQGVKQT
jgi:hypothetical protein